jgi:Ni/Co efflux regulator RcnB
MKLLTSMLLATALATCGGLAMAQPAPAPAGDHGWQGRGHGHGHDRGDEEQLLRPDDDRGHGRGHGRGHDRDWVPPGHRWERGHRYDGPVYVVHDYREYRLRPPPRGYHWVRSDDGQYLLIGIATGIIQDQVLH